MTVLLWLACAVAVSVVVAGIVCMAESLGYRVRGTDTDTLGAYRDDFD